MAVPARIAAILDPESSVASTFLSTGHANVDLIFVHPSAPLEEKVAACAGATAIVATRSGEGVSPELLRRCRQLKLVQLLSAGYNRLDMTAVREIGIPVATNGGANAIAVAEQTLALMLAVYRHLPHQWSNTRQRHWNQGLSRSRFREITGKTIGIVGLGRIGREVAKRLTGFECRLLCHDPGDIPPHVAERLGVTPVGLDELLRESDIVTLHVPLVRATRSLIGQRELGLMKRDSVLINTCRGPVVDEEALVRALQGGRIAGAGLDVLDREPPDGGNLLLDMESVVVTPHSASASEEGSARSVAFAFANVARVARGEPAQSVVNPED